MGPRAPLTDKCIVLDLDETLIATIDPYSDLERLQLLHTPDLVQLRERLYILKLLDAGTKRGKGERQRMWGIERPYLAEFLNFCFLYFEKVIIWTAAEDVYAEEVCKIIFRNVEHWPDLIYSSAHCDYAVVNGEKVRVKPIEKLLKDPRLKGTVTADKVFVVDNNQDTFSLNPENAIHIPDFDPKLNLGKKEKLKPEHLTADDQNLLVLQEWFLQPKVAFAKDVREINKENIFKTQQITDFWQQIDEQYHEPQIYNVAVEVQ